MAVNSGDGVVKRPIAIVEAYVVEQRADPVEPAAWISWRRLNAWCAGLCGGVGRRYLRVAQPGARNALRTGP